MSRTFLSYSRSDIEFVRRLQKALAEEKEETWVDWSGIPPTAEFAREIEKGIEASDNFVFVISPESVAETSYGLKEIAHAAQMGKRMVPILRRAVPNGAVPEALAKFNYIYFRETDDFETAFALLTTALHSDLAWTSAQARLLVRALEWERQEKDDSFLLRGTDLNDAEAWQAQAATKSGKPTPLQSEYIARSRTSATRRQRQLLGAVAAGLVTAIGLAIYASLQARVARNETAIANEKTVEAKKQTDIAKAQTKIAVEQTHRAEEQAKLATSRNLASESLLVKETQPDLAALLSVESMRMADSYDSRNAIVEVWQAWPDLVRMLHATSSRKLISLLFSSNKSHFVTLDELNNLALWEARSLRPIWAEHLYYGASAALSGDGSLIAVQVYGRITIERTADRRILWKDLKGGTKDIRFFSFNPDGTLFAAGSEEGIQVWSMADGLPLRDLSREQETATTYGQSGVFAFDPVDSKTLAITRGNRVVEFEDALSGKVAKAIPIKTDQPVEKFRSEAKDFLSRGLSFSSDGKRMAVNAGYQKVQVWKLDVRGTAGPGPRDRLEGEISVENHRTGTVNPDIHDDATVESLQTVAFSPDGKYLAATTDRGGVGVWDADTREEIPGALSEVAGEAHALAFTPEGLVAVAASHGQVLFMDPNKQEGKPAGGPNRRPGSGIGDLSYANGGHWIVSLTYQSLGFWDVDSQAELGQATAADDPRRHQVVNFAVSLDGSSLVYLESDILFGGLRRDPWIGVQRWNIITSRGLPALTDRPRSGEHRLTAVSAGHNGAVAAISDLHVVRVWQPGSGTPKIINQLHGALCAVVSPRQSLVVAAIPQLHAIRMWDFENNRIYGKDLAVLGPSLDLPVCPVFAGNGSLLAYASSDKLWIWRVSTGELLGTPLNRDLRYIQRIVFSPDGRLLFAVIGEGGAELWDVETQQILGTPFEMEKIMQSRGGVAFSPDGLHIAAGWGGRSIMTIYDNVLSDWPELACTRANRNLSGMEWLHYFGARVTYHQTCKQFPDGEGVDALPKVVGVTGAPSFKAASNKP